MQTRAEHQTCLNVMPSAANLLQRYEKKSYTTTYRIKKKLVNVYEPSYKQNPRLILHFHNLLDRNITLSVGSLNDGDTMTGSREALAREVEELSGSCHKNSMVYHLNA